MPVIAQLPSRAREAEAPPLKVRISSAHVEAQTAEALPHAGKGRLAGSRSSEGGKSPVLETPGHGHCNTARGLLGWRGDVVWQLREGVLAGRGRWREGFAPRARTRSLRVTAFRATPLLSSPSLPSRCGWPARAIRDSKLGARCTLQSSSASLRRFVPLHPPSSMHGAAHAAGWAPGVRCVW